MLLASKKTNSEVGLNSIDTSFAEFRWPVQDHRSFIISPVSPGV
jgi:hypothetical protein